MRLWQILTMDTTSHDIPPHASRLAPKLRDLADRGVHSGTSSWKYEGWLGGKGRAQHAADFRNPQAEFPRRENRLDARRRKGTREGTEGTMRVADAHPSRNVLRSALEHSASPSGVLSIDSIVR